MVIEQAGSIGDQVNTFKEELLADSRELKMFRFQRLCPDITTITTDT